MVNVRDAYDVYIGRAGRGQDGYHGNPFRVGSEADREVAIAKFKRYFLDRVARDPEFRRRTLELKGKRLACFCRPAKACHGDVIAEWVDEQAQRR